MSDMNEDKLDVIIVGGGLAGLSAAIVLARAGKEVLLIERGDYCGAKNMTGGRLYGHSLEKIIPGFASKAPIERVVRKEKVSLMTENGALDIGYQSKAFGEKPESASYTVLRSKFDRWLAKEAEKAGAEIIPGILVEEMMVEDGRVTGVVATGEEMEAEVVILADGVNSLLAQQLGMKKELEPHQVAVGAKQVIKLGEEVINQRFGLSGNEGMAWLSAGYPTDGSFGGGLLYTNKDSVSVGIVATLSDIGHSELSVPEMLDRFMEHPALAPYLEGGTPEEYSAHLVPEEGFDMIPELVGDGVLLAGDAAGFCVNLGFTVRGMDFAIESGRLAAEAVLKAFEAGDFSARTLSVYKEMLKDSFIMRDLRQYKNFPGILTERAIFEDVPDIADKVGEKLFTVDGKPDDGVIMYALNEIAKRSSARDVVDMLTKLLEAF